MSLDIVALIIGSVIGLGVVVFYVYCSQAIDAALGAGKGAA